jgi:hypothetical protein
MNMRIDPRRAGISAVVGVLCIFGAFTGTAAAACPNEEFRAGKSAALPDCRAYELVTPPDAGNRAFAAIQSDPSVGDFNVFPTQLASPVRDSVDYMTLGSPVPEASPPSGTYDQYEAVRTSAGWTTVRRLTPNGAEAVFPGVGGVDEEHQYTFIGVGRVEQTFDGGSLAEEGMAIYLGNPDGSYELLGVGTLGTERLARGRYISPGGHHIIFTTGTELCSVTEACPVAQLEPGAAPSGTPAVYDRAPDGPTHVISLLPGDEPLAAGEAAAYQGASADGSAVAFRVGEGLYVRLDDAVTEEVTDEAATFAGISRTGDALFYLRGGNIYRFDTETEATDQLNEEGGEVLAGAELVNLSADGSHAYFISQSTLGSEGAAGQPNLYVWAANGGIQFVATVSTEDLNATPSLNNWVGAPPAVVSPESPLGSEIGPGANGSRSTPDGSVLAFESHAKLTAYENEGHREIYRYDAETGEIACVSCNMSGPSTGEARFQNLFEVRPAVVVHNLSDDGSRVFFETSESLVGRDLDGLNDIYEWQQPAGGGAPSLDLISSGQTPSTFHFTNTIFAITPSGGDVIFSNALEQLVPSAPVDGVSALYDARVGGGFPEATLGSECSGESCQSVIGPPAFATQKPEKFHGTGNVRSHRRKCRRRRHARKHHGKAHRPSSCQQRKKRGAR